MDAAEYARDVRRRKFIQLNTCITIKTASTCLKRDKKRFFYNLNLLCGNIEPGKCDQQVILDTDTKNIKILITRDGDIVFHYEDGVDGFPVVRSRRTGVPFVYRKCCFNTVCWLPNNESPIAMLKRDTWYHISKYLNIEEKRTMRCVSKRITDFFNQDCFWANDLEKIEQLVHPLKISISISLSMKQRVFRYLLYVSTPEQFVDIFHGEIGTLFAFVSGMYFFESTYSSSSSSTSGSVKRRKTTGIVVETSNKSKHYKSEARVAVGFQHRPDNIITPWFWVSPRGKLRYMSEYKTNSNTWNNIHAKIEFYRNKIIKNYAV